MKTNRTNYHTHSYFCDGKEAPEAYVKEALRLGFKALGFSSHAPVLFDNKYSIQPGKLKDYCIAIEQLKEQYQDQIDIFLALEADYIPSKTHDFEFFREQCPLDYLIGSIHLVAHPRSGELWYIDGGEPGFWDQGFKEVFGSDIRAAVKAFFWQTNAMIEDGKPEILGHFDKVKMHNKNRFFRQDEAWYQKLINESLTLIKEKNTLLEINTRGLYKGRYDELFPAIPVLQKAQEMGIPLMLNTDAHHPSELLGYYSESIEQLKIAGIKELWHLSKTAWYSKSLS
ncbi:MAG: histidinol-phosphatase [Bacteroidales bacterium]|nr:histidinol-phosphatase [Bacteroidales bacterium]